jgi:hypothetical protein
MSEKVISRVQFTNCLLGDSVFLAHLRGAYAITWHLSSVVAGHVIAGAIGPKLCTYVPLGKSPV